MIYILLIWTVVGHGGTAHSTTSKYDWRPLGEFHMVDQGRTKTGLELCEDAARQLGLKNDAYRCIRSK